MTLSDLIALLERTEVGWVRDFAEKAHGDQVRKYTGEPYIRHPEEVASLLLGVGIEDRDVLSAALLHDVVEDTTATLDDIRGSFGSRVAQLVSEVTDVSKPSDGNRRTRKAMDRDHLAKASPEGQSIKLADLISNSGSILAHDPDFAKVYLAEKRELLDVLIDGNPELYARATYIVDDGIARPQGQIIRYRGWGMKIEMRFSKVKWSRDSECWVALFDVAFDGEWKKNASEAAEGDFDRLMAGNKPDTIAALPELQKGLDAIRAKEKGDPIPKKSDMIGGDGEE